MRLLVCVMSCKKHQSIWGDILKRQPTDTIIFTGGGVGAPKLLGNILVLPCGDTYDRLPEKMIHLLAAVRSLPAFSDVTHILKHDDTDAHCSPEAYEYIKAMLTREGGDYVGQSLFMMKEGATSDYHFGKVHADSRWNNQLFVCKQDSRYCGGGKSYILSRTAMDHVLTRWNPSNTEQLYEEEIFEDVMMGRALTAAGVVPTRRFYYVQCSESGSSNVPFYKNLPFKVLVPR